MFDCAEAFRLCSPAEVEVVSIGGECKEVNIYTEAQSDTLRVAVIGEGEWSYTCEDMAIEPDCDPFTMDEFRYLLVPDVALQKARVAIVALSPYASIWSNNGYAFARELPTEPLPVKVFEIDTILSYHPKDLKRRWKGLGIELMKRDTILSIDTIRKATAARAGSDRLVAVTNIGGVNQVIELK